MSEPSTRISDEHPLSEQISLEDRLNTFSEFVQRQSEKQRATLNDPGPGDMLEERIPHLLVTVMIHGNEVGPLDGLLDVMDALESGKLNYNGVVTCVIGNPEAGRVDQRFVEIDLNRVFDRTLTDQPDRGDTLLEIRRAKKMMRYLDDCDLLIDFHQTILDSAQPFISPLVFDDLAMDEFGSAKVRVTAIQIEEGEASSVMSMRQRGKPAVALELGSLGFTSKARAGVRNL